MTKLIAMQSVQFVSNVPDRFNCSICSNVLQEPELTVCCGQHYCNECLKQWFGKHRRENCPNCRAEGSRFQHVPNRNLKSEINQQKVYCSNKAQGCTWSGELGDMKTHLDLRSGCRYTQVECTNRCGTKVSKKDLDSHVRSYCPLRSDVCQYCKKQDTARALASHKDVCPKFPVHCPNSCTFRTFPRESIPAHLNTCSRARQPCPFESVGCTVRDKPDDIKKHVSSNQAQHMTMLMESHKKVLTELKETKQELKETKQELTKTASKLETETEAMKSLKHALAFEVHAILKASTENERIGAFRSIQSQLEEEELDALDSLIFRVLDFSKHVREGTTWYSSPFIIEGYKVCLAVHPKGTGSGLGTHASLSLVLLDIVSSSPDSKEFTSALEEIRVMVPLFQHDANRVHRVFLKEIKGILPFDLSPLRAEEKRRTLGTLNEWIPHIIVKGELENQSFIIKIERTGDPIGQALLATAMRASALRMAAREDCRPS